MSEEGNEHCEAVRLTDGLSLAGEEFGVVLKPG